METMLETGYRVSGAIVNLAAAGAANAGNIFIVSAFAGQIGTKTFIPKKLMVRNNGGGGLWLAVGTGVGGAFVARYPQLWIPNNIDSYWQEVELPRVEFVLTMTAYPVALPAGSLDVLAEVEELG